MGCKSHVATLNGHMTVGLGDPAFLEKETGWQSLVTFLANLCLGKKKNKLNYLQKHTRFPFLFLLLKLLLGNSAHKLHNAVQMIRSYELTHQRPNFGHAKTSFQTIIIEGG